MDYEKYLIKDFKFWSLYLHKNQYYLGRTYLWAKRDNAIDFIDTTDKERKEFFKIVKKYKNAIETLFNPDLFNYAALGNIDLHLHIHLIPRYKEPKQFNGVTFKDERWGKNYAPYDYDFFTSEQTLNKIKKAIKDNL